MQKTQARILAALLLPFASFMLEGKRNCCVAETNECRSAVALSPESSAKKDTATKRAKTEKTEDVMKLLDRCYVGISGFGIPQQDEENITKKGGAPTYGEILYESLKTLLDDLNIKKNDVFYDFGSGVGKTCLQAYLDYPFKKVVGIELSEKRFNCTLRAMKRVEERGLIDPDRELIFLQEDFAETDAHDATVIYMCSTCYSPELMLLLTKKFSALKKGLKVITFVELPEAEEHGFVSVAQYKLPMTWSKDTGGSPVHVYKLTKKKKKKKKGKKESPTTMAPAAKTSTK